MRVASLLPAATEIVCALGAEPQLVGRSHECDFPPSVRRLPALTRERSRLAGGSGEIHAQVLGTVEQALALYEVDVAALQRADPDVIVTQDLCEVCALDERSLLEAVRDVLRPDTCVVSLGPTRLAEVLGDVAGVAEALQLESAGQRLIDGMRGRLDALAARSAAAGAAPSVLSIEWLDPIMVGGLWMPELIEIAGGRPLLARPGEPATTLSEQQLTALDPEVVLIKPCGFDRARALAELERALTWRGWLAAPGRRVYVADGSAYFNRSGPRLVDSAEILAACVAPSRASDLAARHAAAFCRYSTPAA